jgi:hypothetical protein
MGEIQGGKEIAESKLSSNSVAPCNLVLVWVCYNLPRFVSALIKFALIPKPTIAVN